VISQTRDHDICIIGGAGHVGLPLALVFARAGRRVLIYDLNRAAIETIKSGTMPFIEYGAEPLEAALRDGLLAFSSRLATSLEPMVVVAVDASRRISELAARPARPVQEHRFPLDPQTIISAARFSLRRWHVLGPCRRTAGRGTWYCPERIAQGYAIASSTSSRSWCPAARRRRSIGRPRSSGDCALSSG
jgi:UDP-N-acetyl-D-mannosaminuronic acid dehydrogenase